MGWSLVDIWMGGCSTFLSVLTVFKNEFCYFKMVVSSLVFKRWLWWWYLGLPVKRFGMWTRTIGYVGFVSFVITLDFVSDGK